MPIDAGEVEKADFQRSHVLSLADNKGFECVTKALETMIQRERSE